MSRSGKHACGPGSPGAGLTHHGRSPMHKRFLLALTLAVIGAGSARRGRVCRLGGAHEGSKQVRRGQAGRHAPRQPLGDRLRVPRSGPGVRLGRLAGALRHEHDAAELPGQAGARRARGSPRRRLRPCRRSRRTARPTRSRSSPASSSATARRVTAASFKRAIERAADPKQALARHRVPARRRGRGRPQRRQGEAR